MDEELEDIKTAVEEAIIKKNEKDFFIAYARWQDIVYHPDFPSFEEERVFEEGWEYDVKSLGWYGTTEEFSEKLLEAAKLSDTFDYKLREAKKEIDKYVKKKDIRELADIHWRETFAPSDIMADVLEYLDVKLREANLLVAVSNEFARIGKKKEEKKREVIEEEFIKRKGFEVCSICGKVIDIKHGAGKWAGVVIEGRWYHRGCIEAAEVAAFEELEETPFKVLAEIVNCEYCREIIRMAQGRVPICPPGVRQPELSHECMWMHAECFSMWKKIKQEEGVWKAGVLFDLLYEEKMTK